jgi:anionic cell wall polymer biosynthesis LytR-Cps2A-Psr (LCP) family protein
MSFDDDDRKSGRNSSDEDDFYDIDSEDNKSNGSMDDFLKDEDFEFDEYKDKDTEFERHRDEDTKPSGHKDKEDIEPPGHRDERTEPSVFRGRSKEPEIFRDRDFDEEEPGGMIEEGVRSRRTQQRKKKRRGIFLILTVVLILAVAAAGIIFWVVPWAKNKFFNKPVITDEERIDVPESLALGKNINMVFACAGENLLEPDISTIIFSSYYSSGDKLISLCIPPRTLMDIPTIGAAMINRSVSEGGMDLLDLSLENNLGMDIEVDYHMLFDVYNTVNELGGIVIELDEGVTVKNYDNGSTFDLEKGENLIDGAEALNFLKYFSGMEEDVPVESITNQKLVIDAIIKKVVGESEEELSTNINLINDYMDTNLSMEECLKIFSTFSGVEQSSDKVYSLEVSSTELEGEGIVYVPQNISELSDIFSKDEVVTPDEETGDFTETVKITILNGAYDSSGAIGLASSASETFGNLKFDDGSNKYSVVDIGNSDNIYDETRILVYSPDANKLAAADEILQVLGVGSINMRENEVIESDIIIIIGKDYLALTTSSAGEEVEETRIVKIIVINGEGTNKLAATVSDILAEHFNADEERVVMLEPRSADNYNYTETEITIYNSSDLVNGIAQGIQERLGVGKIGYSDNNVDNTDISVTVGSDYTSQ